MTAEELMQLRARRGRAAELADTVLHILRRWNTVSRRSLCGPGYVELRAQLEEV